jgi:hypothetical protein
MLIIHVLIYELKKYNFVDIKSFEVLTQTYSNMLLKIEKILQYNVCVLINTNALNYS